MRVVGFASCRVEERHSLRKEGVAMTKHTILSAAAAIALAASSALAADKLSKGEEHFLKEAAVDNMCEIKMSEVAQSQATDPQVKQLAQQMIQDHQQAGDQLKQLAQSKGVNVPN